MSFESFADEHLVILREALIAAYGLEVGSDAAAEAMAYGFEHWSRLSFMENPAGYLYRVGQTAARRSIRRPPQLPRPEPAVLPDVEPGLVPALEALTELQRTCVVLVHGFGWTRAETALLLEIDESTVRTHIRRALKSLNDQLEVHDHAHRR